MRNGAYCKIWEVRDGKGNYKEANISVSRKNKQSGNYDKVFGAWVRLVGTAKDQVGKIDLSKNVKIAECEITNNYDKDKKTMYWNPVIYAFDLEGSTTTSAAKQNDDFVKVPDNLDSEALPFN